MQTINRRMPVAERRKLEYPEVGAQLDALVALAEALRDQGIHLPDKTLAWLNQCQGVKQKHPKNEPT